MPATTYSGVLVPRQFERRDLIRVVELERATQLIENDLWLWAGVSDWLRMPRSTHRLWVVEDKMSGALLAFAAFREGAEAVEVANCGGCRVGLAVLGVWLAMQAGTRRLVYAANAGGVS